MPPAARPNSAEKLLTPTWNSLIAAWLIEYDVRVRPRASEKNAWLLSTPSTRVVVVEAGDAAVADEAEVAVVGHAGAEEHEVLPAAAVDRQVLDRRLADDVADVGAPRVDERRLAGDGDGFGHARRHASSRRPACVWPTCTSMLPSGGAWKPPSVAVTSYVPGCSAVAR